MQTQCSPKRYSFLFSLLIFIGILSCLTWLIEFTGADARLADVFYTWEGHRWQLKDAWITAQLIHKVGKYISIALLLGVVFLWYLSLSRPQWMAWKTRLEYVFIASLSGTLLVSLLKSVSNISCPWEFARYGGSLEYLTLIDQLWVRNGAHCFPAGHASAGYAWVSLYFVGLHTQARWRWYGLAFAVLLGGIYGVAQQLRGAHFLSHDLWSFGVCWITSFICYRMLLDKRELAD